VTRASTNALSPKKLLHTKWTAVAPRNKEKHFLVTKVIEPVPPGSPVVSVEIEAVHSKRTRVIPGGSSRTSCNGDVGGSNCRVIPPYTPSGCGLDSGRRTADQIIEGTERGFRAIARGNDDLLIRYGRDVTRRKHAVRIRGAVMVHHDFTEAR